ncbi:MAG: hypothetical protein ACK40L_08980 [Hydrogenophaga sp.]
MKTRLGEIPRPGRQEQPLRPLAFVFTNQGQLYTPGFDHMDDDMRAKNTV